MDEAAFHGPVGEFVRLVEPETEADSLALAGHTIRRTAHVRVGPSEHYPNLCVVKVGPSGSAGRKGTAWAESRRLFKSVDPAAYERILGGIASGEGITRPRFRQLK